MSNSASPWTVALQASLSMAFSRQEYWGGLLFPSPGGLPYPEIKPGSPAVQADSLPTEPPGKLNKHVWAPLSLQHVCYTGGSALSHFSRVWLFETLWTIAHQALLSMDSPGKETGVGYSTLLWRIFLAQGSDASLCVCCPAGRFFTTEKPAFL